MYSQFMMHGQRNIKFLDPIFLTVKSTCFARDMVTILCSTFNTREGKQIIILKFTPVIKKRACTRIWIASRNCATITALGFNGHGYRRLFERVPRVLHNISWVFCGYVCGGKRNNSPWSRPRRPRGEVEV